MKKKVIAHVENSLPLSLFFPLSQRYNCHCHHYHKLETTGKFVQGFQIQAYVFDFFF